MDFIKSHNNLLKLVGSISDPDPDPDPYDFPGSGEPWLETFQMKQGGPNFLKPPINFKSICNMEKIEDIIESLTELFDKNYDLDNEFIEEHYAVNEFKEIV